MERVLAPMVLKVANVFTGEEQENFGGIIKSRSNRPHAREIRYLFPQDKAGQLK